MSYSKAGVSEEAATKWIDKISSDYSKGDSPLKAKIRSQLGDYASVYELSKDHWVASACDGVGTKLLWTVAGLGRAEDLAQDLLAMTANDLLCVGANPQLFLDYMAIGNSDLLGDNGMLSSFISSLQHHCLSTGQLLVGGETAQLPDLYESTHFDLAGFGIGFMKPEDYFDINKAQDGDELWGWESSGPHSNGYSWLRKCFDANKDAEFISKHLMPATRLYVNEFRALRAQLDQKTKSNCIRAAYHITGTGFLNLLRKQPEGRKISFEIKLGELTKRPWIQAMFERQPKTERKEFYRTFNMGVGFCILFSRESAQQNRSILEKAGLVHLGCMREDKPLVVDDIEL